MSAEVAQKRLPERAENCNVPFAKEDQAHNTPLAEWEMLDCIILGV